MDKNLKPFLVELVGSFALVLLSAGVVITSQVAAGVTPQQQVVGIALAQGFILAAMLSATMNVSGGFLNPAVTLTLWVFKRIDGNKACWLVGAQLLGAALAGLCLRFMFQEQLLSRADVRLGTPHLNMEAFGQTRESIPSIKILASGIGVELVLTFIVTFTILGTILDPRGPRLGGLGVGLAQSACVLMGFWLTGAAVNPARWLGTVVWEMTVPALKSGAFADHAVYWIGPILGALIAGGLYLTLILPPEEEKPAEKK